MWSGEKSPAGRKNSLREHGRHGSAHLINIHERRALACPYAMTQHDNCGSRLLQPLVSVTKIGTQVSCHSKSLFFRSLSIKRSGPHAKMPRGEERRLSRGRGASLREGSKSRGSPGRNLKKKMNKINVYTGEEGVKYVGGFGGRGGLWKKRTGERSKRGPSVSGGGRRRRRRRSRSCPRYDD